MYTNILIPVALDHEHDVAKSIAIGKSLSAEGGKITALHVIESVPGYVEPYLPAGHAEEMQAHLAEQLNAAVSGADGVDAAIVHGHSSNTILEYAEAQGCDLIIIDSHRPGLQDFFLGSTAARVVRHAHCAVHVLR